MDAVQIITIILAVLIIAAAIKNIWDTEKIEWPFVVFILLVMIPICRTLELF